MQTSRVVTLAGMSGAIFLASIFIVLGTVSEGQDSAITASCNLAEDSQCAEGTDAASLLQGIVHIDLIQPRDAVKSIEDSQETLAAPTELLSEASHSSPSAAAASADATLKSNTSPTKSPSASHVIALANLSSATSSVSRLIGSLRTRATGSFMLVFLVLLCFGCCTMVITYPSWSGKERRSPAGTLRQGSPMPPEVSSTAEFPRVTTSSSLNLPQYAGGASRPSLGAFADYPSYASPANTGIMPHMSPALAPLAPFSKQVPPPLCPTLVMPVCEARFGIPMTDIARLGVEGEIDIVGLSGNPLLRSFIKVDQTNQRILEICMPEKNSAPRATVAPSQLGLATPGYDIRGMKGSFYGFLEIQSSGTCCVIKDGQTVLLLDGDTNNLQLSIKSGLGLQLASVRCSAEPFGGVDHVEIRVEPGVDTVLVLAVVLAVLVLAER